MVFAACEVVGALTAMKPEESTAKAFLLRSGFADPIYEPDGNVPPDFSVRPRIGIEVRRLNQNLPVDGEDQGAEQLSIPLWRIFVETLESFDSRYEGQSYWVGIEYTHSFRATQRIKDEMRNVLEAFISSNKDDSPHRLRVNDGIILSIYPSHPTRGRVFKPAGSVPFDEGGPVVRTYAENIRYCIRAKSKKIGPYKHRYNEWWLILVDYMGLGFGRDTVDELKILLNGLGDFNRLSIITADGQNLLMELLAKELV